MKSKIHRLICWYMRRSGGAFHCYPYGEAGRYVVLMTERQYDRHTALAARANPGEQLMEAQRAIFNAKDEEV